MKNNWPIKALILSVSLSILFSLTSQSLQPYLPVYFSVFIIALFIFLAVVFDMISLAFTTIKEGELDKFRGQRGYVIAKKLYDNCDKVASFAGDVVGDICGILSGAGGVSLVVSLNIQNATVFLLCSCLTSSLIAGLTIFFKAVMKNYAMKNCTKVAMLVGKAFDLRKIKKN